MVSYPDVAAERTMLLATTGSGEAQPEQAMTADELLAAQALIRRVPVSERVLESILSLVRGGRPESTSDDLVRRHVAWGPGPRAAQAMMLACRARALLDGRLAPSVEDVAALAPPVLRHRMALTFWRAPREWRSRPSSTDWWSALAEADGRLPSSAARQAEALGARLPALMAAADRVAATVAQGVHGRRRVGQGDSFWQFRPFVTGDSRARIDWRQSGKSDRSFVRETEWEAAQTVGLWRDGSENMRWRSRATDGDKRDRAGLLLLALASLLLRGGERVMLMAQGARALAGRAALDRLAAALDVAEPDALPSSVPIPRHAAVVLFGDFLSPLEAVQATVAQLASIPVSGHLLQVLDPAEAILPYAGRVRFRGVTGEQEVLIPRVETIRDAYGRKLAAHQAGLADICAAAGFSFAVHQTDHPPEAALLGLYTRLDRA